MGKTTRKKIRKCPKCEHPQRLHRLHRGCQAAFTAIDPRLGLVVVICGCEHHPDAKPKLRVLATEPPTDLPEFNNIACVPGGLQ